ncbi:MAG: carboxylating nicotinate-nucleotide diphosphorylase [Pirellulaceae bacterium]|nr:carboxylating nicotinate-nucleotide diphosphorylase [Pirellulaceae bacterium]
MSSEHDPTNLANRRKEFAQIEWDERLEDDCRQLVRLAVREDLDCWYDLTTLALIDERQTGQAAIAARQPGVMAGIRAVETALDEMETRLKLVPALADGTPVSRGQVLGTLSGSARDLLTCERLLLNLIGRLSGVATLTRRYVEMIGGRATAVYDTRKTTPGWRRLEKYAVRCGGGRNHRTGLFDAVLIKDNHLALAASAEHPLSPAQAVRQARQQLRGLLPNGTSPESVIVEIEVDTLEQLDQVLTERPDIVLLDNMRPEQLREAVRRRDAVQSATQLEASGGVNLDTVAEIADSGVERISVGALTHAAVSLDVGLDWFA